MSMSVSPKSKATQKIANAPPFYTKNDAHAYAKRHHIAAYDLERVEWADSYHFKMIEAAA
jgi:hypothetical protein